MRITILFSFLFCLNTSLFSQWNEIPLPSVNPENRIISDGENLFTYQSPGGVFISTDGGFIWERSMIGLPQTSGYKDLIYFNRSLYVITNYEGVYKSNELGDNWEKVNDIPINSYSYFAHHNNKLFLISNNEHIYMSDENGENWTQTNNPESLNHSSGSDRTFIFSSGAGNLMVFAENQLFHSSNSGNSWSETILDPTIGTITFYGNRISTNGSSIWATVSSSNLGSIIFYSLDDGSTWQFIDLETNFYPDTIVATDEFVAYTVLKSIYYSDDNGVTWSNSWDSSAENILYTSTAGFLLTSNDSARLFDPYTQEFTEFESTGIKNYKFDKVIDMGDSLVLQTNSSFKNLTFLNKESNTFRPIARRTNGDNYLYDITLFKNELHGVFEGKIYKLLPDTESWIASFQHPTDGNLWTLDNTETNLYAGGQTKIYYSDDTNTLTDVGVDVTLNGVLNVLENDTLKIIGTQQLNLSHNEANWKTIDPDQYLADYEAIEVINSKIFVSTINGFYWTDNLGASWQEIESTQFGHVRCIKHYDDRIYIGADKGVFVSLDEGMNWIPKNENQNYFKVKSLLFDGTYAYANTIGGGLWKRPINELYEDPVVESTDEESGRTEPEKLKLFPNPSSSSVNLEVDGDGPYEIHVFNLKGNLVKKTVGIPNDKLLNLEIDALSTGNYIINVTFKDKTTSYRLVKK